MNAGTVDMQTVVEAALAHYGEDAVAALLDLAPLLAPLAAHGALIAAQRSFLADVDGTLIIRVPGLPGELPKVSWASSDLPISVLPQRPFSEQGK